MEENKGCSFEINLNLLGILQPLIENKSSMKLSIIKGIKN